MTTKRKPAKSKELLFQVFGGQAVTIMIDRDSEQIVSTDTKTESLKAPIIISGILLAIDENYLYLGYDEEIINQAIVRSSVKHIELMDDPLDEIMNSSQSKSGGMN